MFSNPNLFFNFTKQNELLKLSDKGRKLTPTTFVTQIRKSPNIPQSHGVSDASHDEIQAALPPISFFQLLFLFYNGIIRRTTSWRIHFPFLHLCRLQHVTLWEINKLLLKEMYTCNCAPKKKMRNPLINSLSYSFFTLGSRSSSTNKYLISTLRIHTQ